MWDYEGKIKKERKEKNSTFYNVMAIPTLILGIGKAQL
jgi:hypothetical protein